MPRLTPLTPPEFQHFPFDGNDSPFGNHRKFIRRQPAAGFPKLQRNGNGAFGLPAGKFLEPAPPGNRFGHILRQGVPEKRKHVEERGFSRTVFPYQNRKTRQVGQRGASEQSVIFDLNTFDLHSGHWMLLRGLIKKWWTPSQSVRRLPFNGSQSPGSSSGFRSRGSG